MKVTSLLVPPTFDDDEKTRIAALLHVILLAGLAISSLFFVMALLSGLDYGQETLLSLIVILVMLGLFLFARSGHIRPVSFLLVVGIWASLTVNILMNGGIRNPAFSGYVVPILVAGFLLNRRWTFAFTVLSLGVGILLIFGEQGAWSPQLRPYNLFMRWAINSAYFLSSAVLVALATRSIQRMLDQTQFQESALRESNRLLYKEMIGHGEAQKQLKERNQELTALYNIGRHLAATLDVQEICRIIYRDVTLPIFGAAHITVALFNEATQMITCIFSIIDGEETDPQVFPPMPLGEGPTSNAIRTGETAVVDLAQIRQLLARQGRFFQIGDDRLPNSALYIPLIAGDKVIGVIDLQHYDENAFDHIHTEFIEVLINNAAVALANALLYQQARQEITERKHTESALSQSNSRLKALLAALPDQALLFDKNGYYKEIIHTYIAADEQENIGARSVNEVLPGAAGDTVLAAVQRTIETGETQVENYAIYTPANQMLWFEGRSALIPDSPPYQDEPLVLWLARDITNIKAAETEKLESERLLLDIENDKRLLAEREAFVSTLSHEFRTPLTIIQSSKNLLANYLDRMSVESREEHLERIEEQVDYLTRMIDDLLSLGEGKNGGVSVDRKLVNLQMECQRIFDLVRISTYSQHEVVFDVVDTLGEAMMDVRLLRQILTNLLSNAIKYSPETSTICFRVNKDGDTAVFQVIDSGIGMSPEDLELIFQPFKRGKNASEIQGTGLGMVIVKQAVDALDGTITCESQLGHGTTFIVRLPLIAPNDSPTG